MRALNTQHTVESSECWPRLRDCISRGHARCMGRHMRYDDNSWASWSPAERYLHGFLARSLSCPSIFDGQRPFQVLFGFQQLHPICLWLMVLSLPWIWLPVPRYVGPSVWGQQSLPWHSLVLILTHLRWWWPYGSENVLLFSNKFTIQTKFSKFKLNFKVSCTCLVVTLK